MNALTKVWLARNSRGEYAARGEPSESAKQSYAENGYAVTECYAVPVEEWERVQRELGDWNAAIEKAASVCESRADSRPDVRWAEVNNEGRKCARAIRSLCLRNLRDDASTEAQNA
jgi:hypothetical protein